VGEIEICAHADKIRRHRDDVPKDDGSGHDQQPIPDPEDLERAHNAGIRGFMPLLDLRLSIPIKSGNAAKVVPNPARKPTTSDRRKLEWIRLRAAREDHHAEETN
jgi:hypothetical protein